VYEADILAKLGRSAEADRLINDADKMLPTAGIARSKFERVIQIARVRLLLAAQRNAEAATLAANFSFEKVDLGVQISDGMTNRHLQAQLALALGNARQAQELAQQSLSIIEASSSRAYLTAAEQRFRLISGKALQLSDQANEAEPMLRQAVALGVEVYDQKLSPELADTYIALAQCLLDLNKRDEARTLFAKAHAIHATHRQLGDQYRKPLTILATRIAGIKIATAID
jgi:tetratricopeptide (TPR) repeat protein